MNKILNATSPPHTYRQNPDLEIVKSDKKNKSPAPKISPMILGFLIKKQKKIINPQPIRAACGSKNNGNMIENSEGKIKTRFLISKSEKLTKKWRESNWNSSDETLLLNQ